MEIEAFRKQEICWPQHRDIFLKILNHCLEITRKPIWLSKPTLIYWRASSDEWTLTIIALCLTIMLSEKFSHNIVPMLHNHFHYRSDKVIAHWFSKYVWTFGLRVTIPFDSLGYGDEQLVTLCQHTIFFLLMQLDFYGFIHFATILLNFKSTYQLESYSNN